MFGLGVREFVVLAIILVVLFGSKKIPQLSQSIVEAVHNLQRAFKDRDNAGKNKKNLS